MSAAQLATTSLDAVMWVSTVAVMIPCAFLLIEVVASRWAGRRAVSIDDSENLRPLRIAVLVPAHDEARGIGATVRHLQQQLSNVDRLLVVADNCSDGTALIAREAGAEVTERFDAERRGKGFALAHGLAKLEADPPDVVVFIDADCKLSAGSVRRLAKTALFWQMPVQACYLILPYDELSLPQRIASFAWRLKNKIRPLGCAAMGLPCLLTGSGIALPWRQVACVSLASDNIVEDMQLGLDLSRRGLHPRYCVDALVTSHLAAREDAQASQRRRWEHGHIATLVKEVPGLLIAAGRRRDVRLLGLALELGVPPLALLAALVMFVNLASVLAWLVTGSFGPPLVGGFAMVCLLVAVAEAWRIEGRDLLSMRELGQLPRYALRKLPLYASFVRKRESQWTRTDRDGPH